MFKNLLKKWYCVLFIALLIRITAILLTRGVAHPDEIFQNLEPAWQIVSNYKNKMVAWEWIEGIRSYFTPLIIAGIFKIGILLNLESTSLVLFTRIIFQIFPAIMMLSIYKLIYKLYGREAAIFAMSFYAFWPPFIYYDIRTLTDVPSAAFVLLGACLIFLNRYFWGGIAIGISFLFRFQSAIYAFSLLFFILVRKNRPVNFIIGVLIMLIFQGFLDLIFYDNFFSSPIKYLYFNVISGQSSKFGVLPFYAYIIFIFFFTGIIFTFLIIYAMWKAKDEGVKFFLITNIPFFLIFSAIGHKEIRFLLPFYSFFIAIGIGLFYRIKKFSLKKFIILFILLSFIWILFFDWNANREMCDAFEWIGKQKDLTGIAGICSPWATGGYVYLNRDVPSTFIDFTKESIENVSKFIKELDEKYNYLIVYKRTLPQLKEEIEERFYLLKIFASYHFFIGGDAIHIYSIKAKNNSISLEL